jgi:hypothetical protein
MSTLPCHLSGRPPTQPLHRLLSFGAGMTSDVGPPPPGHLHSDFPLLLGLHVAGSILQTRQRWVATFLSERRFVRKCVRGWASFWEAPWPSARILNSSPSQVRFNPNETILQSLRGGSQKRHPHSLWLNLRPFSLA